MNSHVINIAFDFDDDKVREHLEQTIENTIVSHIKSDIVNMLKEKRKYDYDFRNLSPADQYKAMMEEYMSKSAEFVITQYKDAIIDMASDKLVDKIYKSKAFKEKIGEILNKGAKDE